MRLPRVKQAHDPILFRDGRIRIGSVQYGVGAEIQDDAHGTVWRLLQLLDGSRNIQQVADDVVGECPDLDRELVDEYISTLIDSGYIEDASAVPVESLSSMERERYRRNENFFTWVDTTPRRQSFTLQARLKSSSVVVLGLGGSGSAVASSLVAAGVGRVRCVDYDEVELSNLNRQSLYTEDDIGHPKVERAVSRLQRMNTCIQVEGMEQRLTSTADVARCLEGMNFAVLCADVPHPNVQLWTNAAAIQAELPWSVCFYAGPTLMTGIFVPGETPCYRCLIDTGPSPLRAADGDQGTPLYGATELNGVIAPTAGLAGHFGALEAIYFLTGLPCQTVGRLYHQNLMVYDHNYYITPEFSAGCEHCAQHTAPPRGTDAA